MVGRQVSELSHASNLTPTGDSTPRSLRDRLPSIQTPLLNESEACIAAPSMPPTQAHRPCRSRLLLPPQQPLPPAAPASMAPSATEEVESLAAMCGPGAIPFAEQSEETASHQSTPDTALDNAKREADEDKPSSHGSVCLTRLQLPLTACVIILHLSMEKFSFMGTQSMLSLFLQNGLRFSEDGATVAYHAFNAVCYLVPIAGAILADNGLGRLKTILVFSTVLLVGNVALPIAVAITPMIYTWPIFLTTIGIVAVGSGGVKACLSALAADQLTTVGEDGRLVEPEDQRLGTLFGVVYFAVNLGGLLGQFLMPWLRDDANCRFLRPATGYNETMVSSERQPTTDTPLRGCYPLAFGVGSLVYFASLVVFVAGARRYKLRPPEGAALTNCCRCIAKAFAERRRAQRGIKQALETVAAAEASATTNPGLRVPPQPSSPSPPTIPATSGASRRGAATHGTGEKLARRHSLLHYATSEYPRQFVDDVRKTLSIASIFIPIPVFWALYEQQGSKWIFQADEMEGRLGWGKDGASVWVVRPEQMLTLNVLSCLIAIPITNLAVYPLLDRLGLLVKPTSRIVFGYLLACSSFLMSGGLQLVVDNSYATGLMAPPNTGQAGMGGTRVSLINSLAHCPLIVEITMSGFDDTTVQKQFVRVDGNQLHSIDSLMPGNVTLSLRPQSSCPDAYGSFFNSVHDTTLPFILEAHTHSTFDIGLQFSCPPHPSAATSPLSVHSVLVAAPTCFRLTATQTTLRNIRRRKRTRLAQVRFQNWILPVHASMGPRHPIWLDFVHRDDGKLEQRVNLSRHSDNYYTIPAGAYRVFCVSQNDSTTPSEEDKQSTPLHVYYRGQLNLPTASMNVISVARRFDVDESGLDAALEFRLHTFHAGSLVHILYQMPQIILLTMAEIFLCIPAMTFAYSEAPPGMKTIMQALNLVTVFVGNLLVLGVASLSHRPTSRADEFFVFAGLAMACALITYLLVRRHETRTRRWHEEGILEQVVLSEASSSLLTLEKCLSPSSPPSALPSPTGSPPHNCLHPPTSGETEEGQQRVGLLPHGGGGVGGGRRKRSHEASAAARRMSVSTPMGGEKPSAVRRRSRGTSLSVWSPHIARMEPDVGGVLAKNDSFCSFLEDPGL